MTLLKSFAYCSRCGASGDSTRLSSNIRLVVLHVGEAMTCIYLGQYGDVLVE